MLKGIKLDQFTAVQAIWGPAFMLAAEFCWIFRCSVHLDLLSAVVFCKIHCSQESATSGFHLPDIPLRPANICRGSCRFSSASDFKCLLIFLFWIPKSGTLNYAFWIFDRNVFLRKKSILSFPRCGKLLPQYLPCCWLGYRLNVQISWYLQTLHNIRAICNAYCSNICFCLNICINNQIIPLQTRPLQPIACVLRPALPCKLRPGTVNIHQNHHPLQSSIITTTISSWTSSAISHPAPLCKPWTWDMLLTYIATDIKINIQQPAFQSRSPHCHKGCCHHEMTPLSKSNHGRIFPSLLSFE